MNLAANELPMLDIDGMKDIVKYNVIKLNKPCFFRGRFGVGKSVGAKQAVEELNKPGALEALLGEDTPYTGVVMHDACRLSSYDNVDMRGTPWPDKQTLLTMWFAPGTFPWVGNDAFPDDQIVLLFLDEFTSASLEVMAVCYQLVLDRAIGEHKLKPNVRIMLAGNLDDDKGVVNQVPMPLNNRLTHFQVTTHAEGVCAYLQSIGAPPIFVAFLIQPVNKDLINTYNPKVPTPVVATPRTIEMAVDYYKADMPEALKRASMEGVVGKGWTTQFMGFHDVWRKVLPIKKIIADPEGVPLPSGEDELSMTYATVVNVSGAMSLKNMEPLYKFLCRLDAMYVVLAMTLATARDNALYGTPEFIHYTKRYRDVYNRS